MKYIVRYRNPSRMNPDVEETYDSKAPVNRLVADARKYPGSYYNVEISKVTASGQEILVQVVN